MNEYRIGALSQLISSNNEDKGDIDDLFKASPLPVEEVKLENIKPKDIEESVQTQGKSPKKKKKKKQPKSDASNGAIEKEGKTDNDESSAQDKPLKKKTKKTPVKERDDSDDDEPKYNQPSSKFRVKHEEENRSRPKDEDKEKRTVFIGNLPSTTTKKQIITLLKGCGIIEAVRFRGAARPDMKTTKKQAIIQRKFHEKRQNIIAYARFKDEESVQKSLKLDGNKIGEQTIRIDLASKDEKSETRDQSKAIFVGNLGFATSEDEVRDHFSQCGKITDVRIVRDSQTGIGKGFCYVNFASNKSVKTALDLMGKTTLSGRELRISQSVSRPKKTVTMVPKTPKSGAFPTKKPNLDRFKKSQAKVVKVKRNLPKSFEGQKAADLSKKNKNNREVKKKSKKKPSQGERKRKMIAKHLLPNVNTNALKQ